CSHILYYILSRARISTLFPYTTLFRSFEASQKLAEIMRDHGVDRRIVSTDEIIEIEPALAPMRHLIMGGDYTPEDESGDAFVFRSEEHTSELQSRENLVCRLLLEKKKN